LKGHWKKPRHIIVDTKEKKKWKKENFFLLGGDEGRHLEGLLVGGDGARKVRFLLREGATAKKGGEVLQGGSLSSPIEKRSRHLRRKNLSISGGRGVNQRESFRERAIGKTTYSQSLL